MSERFGEVRSLLNRADAWKEWGRLCDLLDGFEPGMLDAMIFPYVEGHVRRWEASVCVAPREWVYRTLGGEELPFWSIVRKLDLSQEYLNADQLHALLRSDRLGGIEVLDLESNRIGGRGGQVLAQAEYLRNISTLRLGFNALGGEGVRALGGAGALSGLRHLALEENALGGAGALALAEVGWLGQLEELNLARNGISEEALDVLLERLGEVARLTRLVLDGNALSVGGGATLWSGEGFAGIRALELRQCGVQASHMKRWGRGGAPGWREVEVLDLSRNAVSDEALLGFLERAELSSLKRLHLGKTQVTRRAVDAMAAGLTPSLEYLEVPANGIDNNYKFSLLYRGLQIVSGF